MLRTDLKWTLQVRKPVKKKPICHWVWLGSARKSALGQLWGRERAPESWTYLQKKKRPPKTTDWTHNGDAVESGCRGPANLQLEGCGLRGAQAVSTSPGTPSGCFERRAPRSVPNTAPDPPLPLGFGCPSDARRHTAPRSRSRTKTVEECGARKPPT